MSTKRVIKRINLLSYAHSKLFFFLILVENDSVSRAAKKPHWCDRDHALVNDKPTQSVCRKNKAEEMVWKPEASSTQQRREQRRKKLESSQTGK